MNKWIEKVYYGSPAALQNLGISAYGRFLHWTRYGREADAFYRDLMKSQWLSRAEIEEYQRKKLRDLVENAYTHVRYYRDLFDRIGLRPAEIKDVEDLAKIPCLEKEVLRKTPRLLVSESRHGRVVRLNTSGTSGTPLVITCDIESRRRHYAFLRRFRSWFGIHLGMKRATFCGRVVMPPGHGAPPFWRYDRTENNYLFSSYHLSEDNLRHYYDELSNIRPAEICGYPSSIHAIARYIEENRLEPLDTKFIMTTAETVFDHQRDTIEKAFSCPVSDQYGCTEMALFVSQCERGRYHVHPDYGLVEVLDEKGNPAGQGAEGEVVCTSFINRTMPLIRYRLGDRIVQDEGVCECGRAFPAIGKIMGRVDDVITTPDGRLIGRMDPIFKGLRGIAETQIVQTEIDTLVFRIVRADGFRDENEKELVEEIRKRIGNEMKIRFEYLSEIPRDHNGKIRYVVSLVTGSHARGN